MSLQECYRELGGDYGDVMQRLPSETMVKKFVLKFMNDKSFENLCNAMNQGDYKQAFIAAHTLKGICQNLSFTMLYHSSVKLSDALREKTQDIEAAKKFFLLVVEDYRTTANAIRKFESEN